MFEDVFTHIQKIKNTQPLILNLTNYVTMAFVANGLLSLGASPVMTHSIEEVADLVRIAQGVVINIGTLNESFIERVKTACKTAMDFNKTLVLDPVGAGATHYRTVICLDLLEQFQFTVIRGNASEIMALDGKSTQTKGVDTTNLSEEAVESATNLSSKYQATVVISGKNDFIVTNDAVNKIERGTPVMTRITGAGCLLTAVITAFNAVCNDSHFATTQAMLFYNIAGEIAAQKGEAPGSFQHHFLDALAFLPERAHYA